MQAHIGFLLRNCYPNCLVPQLLLNFLLLPCLSFHCSVFNVQVVDASFAHSVSASSLAASRENFVSLRCISSSNRSFRFDLTARDEGFLRLLEHQTNEVFDVRKRQIARPDEEAPLRGASSPEGNLERPWWAEVDSNHRPHDYQSCALAS